ncbi:VCBS repeat-containing protein [Micromonospora sp. NPDC049559]|uniref:FG-GAP repeat domain-containing protein n=1 Tax=Micromonospora sp. NPDC049559 TaxID=3155923 RepID=UPI00341D9270
MIMRLWSRGVTAATLAGLLVGATLATGGPASAAGAAGGSATGSVGIMGAGTNDFTGDGRADLTALYDYGNASSGLFVLPGTQKIEDAATQPYRVWFAGPGNFGANVTKLAAGDFTGDGLSDVLALYDYGGGEAGLFVFPGTAGRGDGATDAYRVWWVPRGNFWPSAMKITAGDVTGDGKADLLAFYDYGNADTGLFVFPGTSAVGDGATDPYLAWQSGRGNFNMNAAKIAAGDFTGDGRADLLALYDYGNGAAGLWVYPGTSGAMNPYRVWYVPANNFNVGSVRTVDTDDINGDGVVDFLAVTDNAVFRFGGTAQAGDGATQAGVYAQLPTQFGQAKVVVGDYDANGFADLIFLLDHGGGSASAWVLSGAVPPQNQILYRVWYTGPGNFWPSAVKVA